MPAVRKLTMAAASVAALGLGALAAPGAVADVGDGNLACNRGEICLSYSSSNVYQKHFWNAGSHGAYNFTNVNNGQASSHPVRDNTYSVWNRDTTCTVKVIDDKGILPDDVHSIGKNQGGWIKLSDSVRNQNDRHERC
jgi:hypothetical protein